MAQGKGYVPSKVDRDFVERAVAAGTAIKTIAECLNISDDTLRKHFKYEILTARERLKGDAVRVLMDSLTDGSLDAAKYVLSRIAGWTEKQSVVVSGDPDLPPIKHEISAADILGARLDAIAGRTVSDPKPE